MNHVTLIKTAREMPSRDVLISSIVVKEYKDIEELLGILMDRFYVFAVHGKGHEIDISKSHFTSDNAIFTYLSKIGHTFKCPVGYNFYDLAGSSLAKFIYECGYVDCWIADPPRANTEDTEEEQKCTSEQ